MKSHIFNTNRYAPFFNSNLCLDLLALTFIALCAFKLNYSIDSFLDVGLADETQYLYQGVKLNQAVLPSPERAPLYAVWYYLLSFFQKDKVGLYYLNYTLLSSLIPLLLYIFLRRIRVGLIIAFLTSYLYLLSVSNVLLRPYSSKFAILVLLIFLIGATYCKPKNYYFVLTVAFLTVAFIRPEYFVPFIVLTLLSVFVVLHNILKYGLTYLKAIRGRALLLAVLSLSLMLIMGNPFQTKRSLVAFAQHFSLNYLQWNKDINYNPWRDAALITQKVFGDYKTIGEAAVNNPAAFLKHIKSNIYSYPGELFRIMGIYLPSRLVSKTVSGMVMMMVYAFISAVVIACVIINLIHGHKSPSQDSLIENIKLKLPAFFKISNSEYVKQLIYLFLLVSLPTMLSVLIIYPRDYYFSLQGLILLILCSLFISNTAKIYSNDRRGSTKCLPILCLCGAICLFLTPNLAGGWAVFSVSIPTPAKTDIKNTILFIRDLNINQKVNFLWPGGSMYSYNVYLGDNFNNIQVTRKQIGFSQFLEDLQINMIIWPEEILKDLRFRDDNKYKEFLKNPLEYGFQELIVPGSGRRRKILVKEYI